MPIIGAAVKGLSQALPAAGRALSGGAKGVSTKLDTGGLTNLVSKSADFAPNTRNLASQVMPRLKDNLPKFGREAMDMAGGKTGIAQMAFDKLKGGGGKTEGAGGQKSGGGIMDKLESGAASAWKHLTPAGWLSQTKVGKEVMHTVAAPVSDVLNNPVVNTAVGLAGPVGRVIAGGSGVLEKAVEQSGP